MAIHRQPLPNHIRGNVEGLVIIKHRFGKTILTKCPDMSRVVFTKKQKVEQKRFADAVAYAKEIIENPLKKAAYRAKLSAGKKVFNAAVSDYMRGKIDEESKSSDSVQAQLSYAQTAFSLNRNRSGTERGGKMNKVGDFLPFYSMNSDPPGNFVH